MIGLHLRHFGLNQLILLISNVVLEQLCPIYLNRVFSKRSELDLGSIVQHEFNFEVLVE